jgi:hypothetical protein
MRCASKSSLLAILLAGILVPTAGRADGEDRYAVFVKRNPFALKDPPPPPPAPKPEVKVEEEIPINLKLTGISTLFKRVRVFMVNAPPNEPSESLSIYEGERKSGVEVIQGGVDIEAGTVRVKIDNYTKTLSFETDGFAGGVKPGQVRSAAQTATPNGPSPGSIPRPSISGRAPSPSSGGSTFKRPLRTAPRSSASPLGGTTSAFRGTIPAPAVNGNTIRLNAQGAPPQNVQPPKYESELTAEQQIIISKANELMNQENPPVITTPEGEHIIIQMPPLPPID